MMMMMDDDWVIKLELVILFLGLSNFVLFVDDKLLVSLIMNSSAFYF